MIRNDCKPRPDFQKIVESQGLVYHTDPNGAPYWKEDAYYSFSGARVDELYEAAKELHQMFLAAAEHVLEKESGLAELEIPSSLHGVIRSSWESDQREFYGRFDLTFDAQGTPKLLEYNADTPTGLLESSIIQWYWKNDRFPRADQFNSIHESLVTRWKELIKHRQVDAKMMHFSSVADHAEDRMTIGYLEQTAQEAGIATGYLAIDRIGWDRKSRAFVDEQNQPIRQLMKLYPWEWLGQESFAPHLGEANWMVLEPAWKAIFASKKLLLVLQELYPDHRYLLSVSNQPLRGDYVGKPLFGREGANVTYYKNGIAADQREGLAKNQSFIFQKYCPLIRSRAGTYAQCGIWMAGPEPVGMGVREDSRPILGNTSHFVPHVIV